MRETVDEVLGRPAGPLEDWLGRRLEARRPVTVRDLSPLSTGFSAETISLVADYDGRSRRLVLRRESPEPAVYPQQAPGFDVEVDIQYRVMRALAQGTQVPLAPTIGYEEDPGVVGAPFFVMGWVDGQVPLVSPSYAQEGFFADAAPAERTRMIDHGLSVMAEAHTLDWRANGLGWLLPEGEEPTAARQLEIWKGYAERELAGRAHPAMADSGAWLEANVPPHDPDEVTLVWGDPRPGNMIWSDFRCVCATDFEAAAVGPFGIDLGWWLMFDRWSHEHSGAPRLAGEPTREQQAELYFRHAGRAPVPTRWYEVFAAYRYCAIVVRIINRTVERQLMPADNDIWLHNQATDCLMELMA